MVQIVVALLLAFIGMVLLAPIYINLLQRLGFGKQIRSDGPEAIPPHPALDQVPTTIDRSPRPSSDDD